MEGDELYKALVVMMSYIGAQLDGPAALKAMVNQALVDSVKLITEVKKAVNEEKGAVPGTTPKYPLS